ncbi:Uncharacterized protein FWK35_00013076 [Aphis craccivora]|uniref:Uncharacterized protein n=1 Tax=Aphis craccivora TaxID=307492 RepID=A0A6G0YIZ7_APHCR|nr:Uncharacterized protein FWK35_00013076 [Aphis craccivora]
MTASLALFYQSAPFDNRLLHSAMKVISGTIKSTQLQWLLPLPVLTNIASPDLRIKENSIKTIKKAEDKKS